MVLNPYYNKYNIMKLFHNNLITIPATDYLLRKMYYTIYCIIYTIQEPKHYIIL